MALGLSAGGVLLGEARTYYVDFDHGSDTHSGTDRAHAWQHAPGDPSARGGPAATTLHAGDTVRFAAASRYRGTIFVTASGTAQRPITFESDDVPGSARAILDGGDVVQGIPCPNQPACGGSAAWQSLLLITLPADTAADRLTLFAPSLLLRPAQDPDPANAIFAYELADLREASGSQLAQGRAPLPAALRPAPSPGTRIALWVRPNLVVERPITGMDGTTALFNPAGLAFYEDRADRIAFLNDVRLIDQDGEYAVLPDRRHIVVRAAAGTRFTLASGRGGFTLANASGITIRRLGFENFADGAALTSGLPVRATGRSLADIRITGNVFANLSLANGQGAITLQRVSNLVVSDNHIANVVAGSGMRIAGPARDITVSGNTIERVGRTAIIFLNVDDGRIDGNVVRDILGVHGNGISVYLDNHNIAVVGNTVTNAYQPITFRGANKAGPDNNIRFSNNVLVSSDNSLGALISWGAAVRGVLIEHNIMIGGKTGLRLNPDAERIIVRRNLGTAITITGATPAGWSVANNQWRRFSRADIAALTGTNASTATQLPQDSVFCALLGRDSADKRIGARARCP